MSNIRRGGTRPIQSNELCDAVQLLADQGFEGMANAMQILLNEAMKIERNEYLGPSLINAPKSDDPTPTDSKTRRSIAGSASCN